MKRHSIYLMFAFLIAFAWKPTISNAEALSVDKATLIQEGAITNVSQKYEVEIISQDVEPNQKKGIYRYGNGSLSTDEKRAIAYENYQNVPEQTRMEQCASAIYNGMIQMQTSIDTYAYALTAEQIREIYSDLVNEKPDLFYIKSGYKRANLYLIKDDTQSTSVVSYITGFYEYANSDETPNITQITSLKNQILEVANNLIKEDIDSSMADYEKAVVLHDFIVSEVSYDNESYEKYGSNTTNYPASDFDIVGVFLNKTAVCQGYALAYKYLLNLCNISSVGYAITSDHIWNTITINQTNYNVDCTWDDESWDSQGKVKHNYLLKSDTVFADHGSYTSDKVCANTANDTMYYDSINSKICYYGGKYYYIKDGELYKTDSIKTSGSKLLNIDASLDGNWTMDYISLARKNSFLIYNNRTNVYAYNIKTGQTNTIISIEGTSSIYGLSYYGNDLIYSVRPDTDTPYELCQTLVKKTYPASTFTNKTSSIDTNNPSIKMSYDGGTWKNNTAQLEITITPSYADNKEVTYKSNTPSLCTVTPEGKITGLKCGTGSVTISTKDGGASITKTIVIGAENIGKTKDGKTCYLENGILLANQYKVINGTNIYLGSDGSAASGILTVSGKIYYFKEGVKQSGFKKVNKATYYFSSNKVMVTGWKTIKKKKYYFNKSGVMQTGFKKIKKKTYYFSSKGVMQTGFKKIKKKTYYFSSKGVMTTGWKTIKKKRYYFNKSGVMQTGKKKIKGKWYWFDKKGKLKK